MNTIKIPLKSLIIRSQLKIISTYSILDGSFTFPKVILLKNIQENLETLQNFEDNMRPLKIL